MTSNTTAVSVYGTDAPGITETTQEIVQASTKKNGYSATSIAADINKAIEGADCSLALMM